MGRVDGKVAVITGAGRGQGRAHALRLAQEGADIIAIDICHGIEGIATPMADASDLAETERLVKATGRRVVTAEADTRQLDEIKAAIDTGVDQLGRLDIVCANAGICTMQTFEDTGPEIWQTTIDINLTGTWNTCFAAVPHLTSAGAGSMILTASTAGLKGLPFMIPYTASKHGVIGIMHVLANELAARDIRVNAIVPTGVDTGMLAGLSDKIGWYDEHPKWGALLINSLDVDVLQPEEVSNAVLFLASDEARYTTGLTLTVDAGATAR